MLLRLYAPRPSPWSRFKTCGLTDPGSFFEALIILHVNYFYPLPIDDIVSLSDMICHCTFVKTDFRWLPFWPGVYLWYIFGIFLVCFLIFPLHMWAASAGLCLPLGTRLMVRSQSPEVKVTIWWLFPMRTKTVTVSENCPWDTFNEYLD